MKIDKTKVMVFRREGSLQRNLNLYHNNQQIEIVRSFSYLGIVFIIRDSCSNSQTPLADQAQKTTYKLNSYLYKFSDIAPRHVLDLFDKLVTPILNYCSEVWEFCKATLIERVQYFNTDRSKAVLLLWFLTVTCSCCPYLNFGSAIMLVTYFSTF